MIYDIQDYDMPNINKLILGSSSFWVLNTIYYSYIKKQYFLMSLLSSISIISPIFWYNYEINSISHKLDFYLCSITFIYTIIRYYHYIHFYDIVLLINFYVLSRFFTFHKEYEFQLYSHLLFRSFFYKIIYLAINDNGFDYKLYYDLSKYFINNILLLTFTENNCDLITYIFYSSQIIIILFI